MNPSTTETRLCNWCRSPLERREAPGQAQFACAQSKCRNDLLTNGLATDEIIALAASRAEFPWQWSLFIHGNVKIEEAARELGLTLHYGKPIRPGDFYLAVGNTGPHLLECRFLGEACVHAVENAYAYDFSRCVLVTME